MEAMRSLLDPKAVAVVGASQRRGRGTNVVANLRDCGFAGEIFAVNPRYPDVLGYKCFPSVSALPAAADCLVVAVAADAACDILEEAHARGIPAAIVLAAGFGEGGHGHARAARLRSLADQGMCICGPNCFGLISVKAGFAAYSGPLARPLRAGPVAIVSQTQVILRRNWGKQGMSRRECVHCGRALLPSSPYRTCRQCYGEGFA